MSNICTIVDVRDNVLGQKDRSTLLAGDIYRIVCLWIINAKGDVLLAQRKLNKQNDPGKWGPAVAGTVEPNEAYEQTIVREAAEELGVSGVELFPMEKRFVKDNGKGQSYFCQVYIVVLDWPVERFTPQLSELEGVRWLGVDDIKRAVAANPTQFVYGFADSFASLESQL